ncbi:MAG: N-acetyl sugar amidotransferase [Bellilinea sp.]
MKRCRTCVYPDTKPDLHFDETGQCNACSNYAKRPLINWDERKAELTSLLDRHNGRCIVPSSGGKDSYFQTLKLLELGADVTIVTARTCHLTDIGRKNIDNLAKYARTIEYVPNMTVRGKLNRVGLELVGDISWPEHVSIFTAPFRAAVQLGIPLIFYGENPQDQYGGPVGSDEAKQMTLRWRSEFGGFLGLRPSDFIGQHGLTKQDMSDYELPSELAVMATGLGRGTGGGVEAHFLGQYLPWDSHQNAGVAMLHGMEFEAPSAANWWPWENLDNAQTGIHDHMMWRKYGYGRGAAQISVDIRSGRVSREDAMKFVQEFDGRFPEKYADVSIEQILDHIEMTRQELNVIMDKFTNWEIMRRVEDDASASPVLIG